MILEAPHFPHTSVGYSVFALLGPGTTHSRGCLQVFEERLHPFGFGMLTRVPEFADDATPAEEMERA